MPTFIDLTPTWQQILPTWLMMYRQAISGDCTNPDLIKANAVSEFESMALGADRWNALTKFAENAANGSEIERILNQFVGAHPDLFPPVENPEPVEDLGGKAFAMNLSPDGDEPATYSTIECEECRGTGCHHAMGEYITDEPCEACSGAGDWKRCDECLEDQDEGFSPTHKPDCIGGKVEAARKEQQS